MAKFYPYIIAFMAGMMAGAFIHAKYICKGQTISIAKVKAKNGGKTELDIHQWTK